MGMVVVISLPLIIFCLLLGFGCYYLGRYKGRQDTRTNAQVFGDPIPPPGFASTPPPPPHTKPDNLHKYSHFLWLEPLTTPKSFPDTPCRDGCLIDVAFWLQKPAGWTDIICSVPPSANNIIILSQADTKHNKTFLLQSKMYEEPLVLWMGFDSSVSRNHVQCFPRQDTEYFPSYMPYQLPWHPPVPPIPLTLPTPQNLILLRLALTQTHSQVPYPVLTSSSTCLIPDRVESFHSRVSSITITLLPLELCQSFNQVLKCYNYGDMMEGGKVGDKMRKHWWDL
ncbi:hypothetical protein POTOM_004197 [Populus tomentosa]|uniref:Uncharacterized protein n=1 Tax=Populus tomentosa TaxID=118781 RepID=A0A8X8AEL8_POPTO|nr:hypothetical protein POTOM_004197 [Populus tomentosa]